jgi:hypothetical protein
MFLVLLFLPSTLAGTVIASSAAVRSSAPGELAEVCGRLQRSYRHSITALRDMIAERMDAVAAARKAVK